MAQLDVTAIEKRSAEERVELLKGVTSLLYKSSESWSGALGMQISYLCYAITHGKRIELGRGTALLDLLIELGIGVEVAGDPDPIANVWDYIDISPDDMAKTLTDEDESSGT